MGINAHVRDIEHWFKNLLVFLPQPPLSIAFKVLNSHTIYKLNEISKRQSFVQKFKELIFKCFNSQYYIFFKL